MSFGHYRLLSQRGAGADGVAYQAWDADADRLVELRVFAAARSAEDRWRVLEKRLRLAALLDHPVAVGVHRLELEAAPPYAVQEWVEAETLGQAVARDVPLPIPTAVQIGCELGAALAAAHRLGLTHGRLGPHTIRLTDAGALRVDFTRADVGRPAGGSVAEVEASCQAPEGNDSLAPDGVADVYALGALLYWLVHGRPYQVTPGGRNFTPTAAPDVQEALLEQWLARLLHPDAAERPSAAAALDHLAALADHDKGQRPAEIDAPAASWKVMPTDWQGPRSQAPAYSGPGDCLTAKEGEESPPTRLGRFHLLEKLGEGGFGAVYKAEDPLDGGVVAIKLFRQGRSARPQALARLRKEARLLAQVRNPYVANLLEMNEDGDSFYLVLEYVGGTSLGRHLTERGRMDERRAVAVMADVARALVDAHRRGILHRDIKPENILLVGDDSGSGGPDVLPRVKLCDFGLARHVEQSASLQLTAEGMAVGTPYYASPEQCYGETVDPRTDVYAIGATLYHLLAGRPPFMADSMVELCNLHAKEPPPPLRRFNPEVSDAVCQIIDKALAKHPGARYADAAAILRDFERLLRGEPADIAVHPRLPECGATRPVEFDWTWDLDAPPDKLWPYVSNTERLNRAVGIPAVRFTSEADPAGGARRFGHFRKAGVTNVWEEHPFEWVEGRRMGVLREYREGVFRWLATTTELRPRAGGGTTLTHRVCVLPRNLLGRLVARFEVGGRGRKAVERVYRRIDAYLTGERSRGPAADPFEGPAALPRARRRRLDELIDRLTALGAEPAVVEKLGEFLALAPPQEVARIRPLALARRLGADPDRLVDACLLGAREGLLVLLWDILCPVCRVAAGIRDTLRELKDHGHCEACNLDFQLDFAGSVEMIFRVHPQVRASELGTYCVGGPVHSPHVVAQVRVAAGERVELDLELTEGAYRLRGPQLPYAVEFRVEPAAGMSRWDLDLLQGPDAAFPRVLRPGSQTFALANDGGRELLVRVERAAPRGDALTAARASALARFRELFSGEVLSAGQLVSVTTTSLLVTDLDQADVLYDQLGDARAFAVLHGHFRLLDEQIRREGGALVKTVGEGIVAVFADPVAAVRAALDLPERVGAKLAALAGDMTPPPRLRVGVHQGPTLAATVNDHLDYFGSTIHQATQLPHFVQGGEIVMTQAVARDPQVAVLLQERGFALEVQAADLSGPFGSFLHRLARSPRAVASSSR